MAFSNPIVVTVNSVAKNLARINNDNYGSEYLLIESDREFRMKIRHTTSTISGTKYDRHNVELTETVYAADPVPEYHRKVYLVLENKKGDSATTIGYLGDAFTTFVAGSVFTDLVAWQN